MIGAVLGLGVYLRRRRAAAGDEPGVEVTDGRGVGAMQRRGRKAAQLQRRPGLLVTRTTSPTTSKV